MIHALGDQGSDHQTLVFLKDHEILGIDFINTSRVNLSLNRLFWRLKLGEIIFFCTKWAVFMILSWLVFYRGFYNPHLGFDMKHSWPTSGDPYPLTWLRNGYDLGLLSPSVLSKRQTFPPANQLKHWFMWQFSLSWMNRYGRCSSVFTAKTLTHLELKMLPNHANRCR